MIKLSSSKRALALANTFNLIVAIYFVIIAITALIQLRWYHQLTISVRIRHIITIASSYFAFLILIFVAIILAIIFILSTLNLSQRSYISPGQDAIPTVSQLTSLQETQSNNNLLTQHEAGTSSSNSNSKDILSSRNRPPPVTSNRRCNNRLLLIDSTSRKQTNKYVCYSTLLHLLASLGLVIILIIWLFNTGELVRESISTQLEFAFEKYRFANRSNHYSVAVDGMQDVNICCGALEYTDFPHRRSGLSSGHYPGSCCGKNLYGVNARVLCTPEEVVRAKQTKGCVHVLADYYDLVSLLVVPVALFSLFINIAIIALLTVTKVYISNQDKRDNPGEAKPHTRT